MVNNITNNKISDISAKESVNTLNEIKNAEIIKYERPTPKQKEVLNLFNDLSDTILTDKTLKSKSQEDGENENENVNENVNENENDETLMSSDKNVDEITKILMHSHEYAETTNQNEKIITMKKFNDHLDQIIDKSKSFEEKIKSLEKIENLEEYYFICDFDNKVLEFKIFKLKLTHLWNIIGKKLFEQIFGHKFGTLANKLINTTNKEENQIIVKTINKNKEKLYKQKSGDWVIQPNNRQIDLLNTINLILNFNKTIQFIWFENIKIKKWVSYFNWGKHSKIMKHFM